MKGNNNHGLDVPSTLFNTAHVGIRAVKSREEAEVVYSCGKTYWDVMTEQHGNCVFCRICNEEEQTQIMYKDDEYVVFPDKSPAAKHHYLIVTREHIGNVKQLTAEHKHVVEKLVEIGKKVLTEQCADLSDVRFGFHYPPFNSIQHLHLHAISPASSMSFVSRLIFRPDSWWFVSEYVLASYFAGRFLTFLKQCGLVYLPVTSGGSLSLPSALHARSTITHCFDFIPPLQGSLQKPEYVTSHL